MGASVSGHTGYDNNAWFFEGGNGLKVLAKLIGDLKCGSSLYGYSLLEDLLRYF